MSLLQPHLIVLNLEFIFDVSDRRCLGPQLELAVLHPSHHYRLFLCPEPGAGSPLWVGSHFSPSLVKVHFKPIKVSALCDGCLFAAFFLSYHYYTLHGGQLFSCAFRWYLSAYEAGLNHAITSYLPGICF